MALAALNAKVGVATTPGMEVMRSGDPNLQPDMLGNRGLRLLEIRVDMERQDKAEGPRLKE